MFLFNRR